jgi:hypothetical protein
MTATTRQDAYTNGESGADAPRTHVDERAATS